MALGKGTVRVVAAAVTSLGALGALVGACTSGSTDFPQGPGSAGVGAASGTGTMAHGTDNKGVCHDGLATCTNGAWSPCVGEIIPSGEACNNLDDDCNGSPDDNLGTFTCGIGECVTTVNACSAGKLSQCLPKNPPSNV